MDVFVKVFNVAVNPIDEVASIASMTLHRLIWEWVNWWIIIVIFWKRDLLKGYLIKTVPTKLLVCFFDGFFINDPIVCNLKRRFINFTSREKTYNSTKCLCLRFGNSWSVSPYVKNIVKNCSKHLVLPFHQKEQSIQFKKRSTQEALNFLTLNLVWSLTIVRWQRILGHYGGVIT